MNQHVQWLYKIFLKYGASADQDGNTIIVTYNLKTYEYVLKYIFLDSGEVEYIGVVRAGPPCEEDLRLLDKLKKWLKI